MIKVFYGPDSGYTLHCVEKMLKKDLKKEEYESIIRFDGYKDLTYSVVEDCSSISLFGEKKIVLFTNCYFLSSSSNRKSPFTDAQQGDYKAFKEYLSSPNCDSDLYLLVDGSLKKSGDLYNALQEGSEVYLEECRLPTDEEYLLFVNKMAKEENKTIDSDAAKMLLERSRTISSPSGFGMKQVDYLTFLNSAKKLFTYTSHVRSEDVKELVYRPLDDNVFDIVKKLLNKDTIGALSAYSDLRKSGIEVLGILPAFASKFKDCALTKYLIEMSYDNNTIADILGKIQGKTIKPGSIFYRKKELQGISFSTFLTILSDLSKLEKDVKFYLDDADTRMELFLSLFSEKYLKRVYR